VWWNIPILDSSCGLKQAKILIQGSSAKRKKELLKLNRAQLQFAVGLLTGHCHLKGHLCKLGLTNSPICERCQEKDESATHILCDCEAIAYVRLHHLVHYFVKPSDYHDAPIRKVMFLIRSVGLIKGWIRRGSTTGLHGHNARARSILVHPLTYTLASII
jgi:hypothetical protein